MKLLRRVIVEKRVAIIPIAIAIAANLAVYLVVVYPMQSRVSSGEARMSIGRFGAQPDHRLLAARIWPTALLW